MNFKLKLKEINEPNEIWEFKNIFDKVGKGEIDSPFNNSNFIFACLETIGFEKVQLAIVLSEDEPLEIIPLKKSSNGYYHTVIPPELPHLNKYTSLKLFGDSLVQALKQELGDFVIHNCILDENTKSHISDLGVNVQEAVTWLKLEPIQNLDRWLYKVKPKSREKFSRLVKLMDKPEIDIELFSEPLAFLEKSSLFLQKLTHLNPLSKNLLETLLFQLKLTGSNLFYASLTGESYELAGGIFLEYNQNLFVPFLNSIQEDARVSYEELLILKLIEQEPSLASKNLYICKTQDVYSLRYQEIKTFRITSF